ncbi:MAG TPA: helix-turn-helix transcriptional regulator [Solirubrobacterales bacterium]|nr:helix-turn-helix transcriptional regulator [Solirubrobacterales bacterium]
MPSRPLPHEPQRGLGKAVRKLREEAGWSQQGLADRAGVSASWLSRIESGDYDPTWGTMRRVAGGLDVSLEKLADVAGELEKN